MPGSWVYKDEDESADPPRHPPTEVVPPQRDDWRAPRYSQTQHLAQLNRHLPEEPPPPQRDPQPAFKPRQSPPPRPSQPQYQQQPPYGGYGAAQTPPQPQRRPVQPRPQSYGQPQYPSERDLPPVFQPGYSGRPDERGYYPPPRQEPQPTQPRKKRRVFLWIFLAVQVLFIVWIVAGLASHPAGPSVAQQAAQQCANGGWEGLFKSQADCDQHYAVALNDAGNVGKGIGAALIVVFWVVTDFFLGLGYLVYKLASRR
jgi:hypothetical protein